jgi:hypothetical protein
MREGKADWPSRVWRRVRITSTVALQIVKADRKGTQCQGFNWATAFLGDIHAGSWSPGWESLVSEIVKYSHESWGTRSREWMSWRVPEVIVNDRPRPSSSQRGLWLQVFNWKINSGRESPGARWHDELMGGKPQPYSNCDSDCDSGITSLQGSYEWIIAAEAREEASKERANGK